MRVCHSLSLNSLQDRSSLATVLVVCRLESVAPEGRVSPAFRRFDLYSLVGIILDRALVEVLIDPTFGNSLVESCC